MTAAAIHARARPQAAPVGYLLPQARRFLAAAAADAAAALARHRLSRFALLALLLHSFYSIDEFSGLIVHEFTLSTYRRAVPASNLDVIILRTVVMSIAVTLACAAMAFPDLLLCGALCAGEVEGALLSCRHAAAVVELSGQGLCLEADPRQGRHHQLGRRQNCTSPGCWMRCWRFRSSVGPSLSFSYIGTFLVFCLCLAALHDPADAGRARARAGATCSKPPPTWAPSPRQTFRTVILPLALPGVIAGSIFTFSLTLGDYIIPQIVGNSELLPRARPSTRCRARPETFRSPPPSPSCRSS